jgi:cytochrome P450
MLFVTNMIPVSYMGRYQKDDKAGKAQLINNATIFIAAGTETTTTFLCGAVYHILSNPDVHSKLCQEIRSAAANVQDLNLDLLHSLSYLKACKDEAMRIYPPVPGTLTRLVPKGGGFICGRHVPENTVVGVNQWATYHNAANFKHPDGFHPERWLDVGEKGEYAGDRRNALQPFNYGPRKCIANE